jgi:hypothetical protein
MSDDASDRAVKSRKEEQIEAVDNVSMEVIRQTLLDTTLEIGKRGDVNEIFANAHSFVKLSQGNDTVQNLVLYRDGYYYRDYKTLRVLGEGFVNLEELRVLTIRYTRDRADRDEEDVEDAEQEEMEFLYWKALFDALGRVRHHIELRLFDNHFEDYHSIHFAVAIRGVSTIQAFHGDAGIFFGRAGTLMSALASLPSLEKVTLGYFKYDEWRPEEEEDWQGLTSLLKSPSLRSIEFSTFILKQDLIEALLAAFEEGSFVTNLRFTDCRLRELGHDGDARKTIRALVQGLQRNLSVKTLSFVGNNLLCDGMTSILLVNTTLVDLTLRENLRVPAPERGGWLLPLFVAMRINTSLKSLDVDTFHLTDELVCGALRDALAKNSVLESLALHSPESLDDTTVASWRKTLPFIRDNATLKSLTIAFSALDSHAATLCVDTVAMLEGNTTLECLDITSGGIGSDAYISALESLQPNMTLKILRLSPVLASMGVEEMHQVVSFLKKNYSLAGLDEGVSMHDKTGEVGALLRLNKAGRRYLITDAASMAKGVEVLIDVSDDLGCLFYHLLENPTLCDIQHQYNTKSGTGDHLNKRKRT